MRFLTYNPSFSRDGGNFSFQKRNKKHEKHEKTLSAVCIYALFATFLGDSVVGCSCAYRAEYVCFT